MALVAAVCPNCGGKINVDDTKEAGICESCGTPFVTEKVIHQSVTNNNFAGATVNMTLAVNEQRQFENAMQMAMDAYNAGNEEECKSFCNQALSINPKSPDAKALKGAAVLIAFSLRGAASDAVEALKIWESISDTPSSEYLKIAIVAAFDFRSRWLAAAEAHYKEFEKVKGALDDYLAVQENYEHFMERFVEIRFIRNCELFFDLTLKMLRDAENDTTGFNFAENLANANKDRNDSLGEKAREILKAYEAVNKAEKKKLRNGCLFAVALFLLVPLLGMCVVKCM